MGGLSREWLTSNPNVAGSGSRRLGGQQDPAVENGWSCLPCSSYIHLLLCVRTTMGQQKMQLSGKDEPICGTFKESSNEIKQTMHTFPCSFY